MSYHCDIFFVTFLASLKSSALHAVKFVNKYLLCSEIFQVSISKRVLLNLAMIGRSLSLLLVFIQCTITSMSPGVKFTCRSFPSVTTFATLSSSSSSGIPCITRFNFRVYCSRSSCLALISLSRSSNSSTSFLDSNSCCSSHFTLLFKPLFSLTRVSTCPFVFCKVSFSSL